MDSASNMIQIIPRTYHSAPLCFASNLPEQNLSQRWNPHMAIDFHLQTPPGERSLGCPSKSVL